MSLYSIIGALPEFKVEEAAVFLKVLFLTKFSSPINLRDVITDDKFATVLSM